MPTRRGGRGVGDTGAGNLTGLVVVAIIVSAALGCLIWTLFAATPMTPEESGELAAHASTALRDLLVREGAPGWSAHADALPAGHRIGILDFWGRIDAEAFDAIARGHPREAVPDNGYLDVPELLTHFNVKDYGVRLRAFPAYSHVPGGGTRGLEDYNVALVAPAAGEVGNAAFDAGAVDALNVHFVNGTYDPRTNVGSRFSDGLGVRDHLVPRIFGFAYEERVPASSGGDHGWFPVADEGGFVRFGDGSAWGATPGEAVRVASPRFEAAGHSSLKLSWRERVEGEEIVPGVSSAYGVVEVGVIDSAGDTVWTEVPVVERSTHSGGDWQDRVVTLNLPTLEGGARIALKWTAQTGADGTGGWDVAALRVETASGLVLFETPLGPAARAFDAVVVAGDASLDGFAHPVPRRAIESHVTAGGALVVLAPDAASSLDAFLSAFGVTYDPAPLSPHAPPHRAPVLVTPHALSIDWFPPGGSWRIASGRSLDHDVVLQAGSDAALTLDRRGAFGDGTFIAAGFRLRELPANDAQRFLANALMLAANRDAYVEAGPPIPSDTAVAAASALLRGNAEGHAQDVAFIVYAWWDPAWYSNAPSP